MRSEDTTSSVLAVQLNELFAAAAESAITGDYLCKPCNRFKTWDFEEKRFFCDCSR
jgi:hypothetical protein